MCYNFEVSITAFVVASVFNLILLIMYIHIPIVVLLAIFMQFVVMVQLFEAFTWMGYDELGANGILILTTLQPVVLLLLMLCFLKIDLFDKGVIIVAITSYLVWLIYSLNNNPSFESLQANECGRLDYSFWKKIGSTPYFTLFLIALLILYPADISLLFAGTLAFTLLLSVMVYSCGGAPSLWCLFSVITPVVLFVYLKVIYR